MEILALNSLALPRIDSSYSSPGVVSQYMLLTFKLVGNKLRHILLHLDSKIWFHFLLLDHFAIARIPEKFDNFTKWRWIWLNQATYAWQHGLCYAMLRFKNQICPILSESFIIHLSKCYRYVQFSSRRHISARRACCLRCMYAVHCSNIIVFLHYYSMQNEY